MKFILNNEPFIKVGSVEKENFIKLGKMEKKAIVSFLTRLFPWVGKAMRASRRAPIINIGGKTGKTIVKTPVKFRDVPAQRTVGFFLNPLKKVETWGKLIHKNPRKYIPMAWKQFTQKTWTPKSNQWRTHFGFNPKTKPRNIFLGNKPTVPGGNIYKRTFLGTAAHVGMGTGIGIGAVDAALSEGSIPKKIGEGVKSSIAWGPLQPFTMTKMVGYDVPKMFLAKPKAPRLSGQQAVYHQNQNINYPY